MKKFKITCPKCGRVEFLNKSCTDAYNYCLACGCHFTEADKQEV